MACIFAELNESNIVQRVVSVAEDISTSSGPLGDNPEAIEGETYCTKLFGGTWKQTSPTGSFRKQWAVIGDTYDASADIFIRQQPYASWTLNGNHDWEAPVAAPDPYDGECTVGWDESSTRWMSWNGDRTEIHYWDSNTSTWVDS